MLNQVRGTVNVISAIAPSFIQHSAISIQHSSYRTVAKPRKISRPSHLSATFRSSLKGVLHDTAQGGQEELESATHDGAEAPACCCQCAARLPKHAHYARMRAGAASQRSTTLSFGVSREDAGSCLSMHCSGPER